MYPHCRTGFINSTGSYSGYYFYCTFVYLNSRTRFYKYHLLLICVHFLITHCFHCRITLHTDRHLRSSVLFYISNTRYFLLIGRYLWKRRIGSSLAALFQFTVARARMVHPTYAERALLVVQYNFRLRRQAGKWQC